MQESTMYISYVGHVFTRGTMYLVLTIKVSPSPKHVFLAIFLQPEFRVIKIRKPVFRKTPYNALMCDLSRLNAFYLLITAPTYYIHRNIRTAYIDI